MKSFLFLTVIAYFLACAWAADECPESIKLTLNDCVKIRTDARDSFCVTKQNEFAKCQCVYDTHIKSCYDYCNSCGQYCQTDKTVMAAMQQLDSEIQTQCAAASLNPKDIPSDVYNEIVQQAPAENTNTNTNTNGNTNNNANSNPNQLSQEDFSKSGAETVKFFIGLLIAQVIFAVVYIL